MKSTGKAFFVLTALCFGLAMLFLVYFNYLEYQARQNLPPELRTPEAIQYYFDGSVCLGCDMAGTALFTLFSAIGILTALIWGISRVVSAGRRSHLR